MQFSQVAGDGPPRLAPPAESTDVVAQSHLPTATEQAPTSLGPRGLLTHEHVWHVVYIDFDDSRPSTEVRCSCGKVSYQ